MDAAGKPVVDIVEVGVCGENKGLNLVLERR
jgi:hypothetical protein